MNKKAFIDLEDINPMALILAVVGAIAAIIVTIRVEVSIIYRLGSALGTFVLCYLIVNKMSE